MAINSTGPKYELDFRQSKSVVINQTSPRLCSWQRSYLIDPCSFQCFPPNREAIVSDLISVATAVLVTDRVVPRWAAGEKKNVFQKRHLVLTVPVRLVERWQHVNEKLQKVLSWLTADTWEFKFFRVSHLPSGSFLEGFPKLSNVALFSGGLDSFSGTLQQMDQQIDQNFVLVSSWTNPRQCTQQKKLVRLTQKSQAVCSHCSFHFELSRSTEKSIVPPPWRSRGFFNLSLGAATAISLGIHKLEVYENGIGAINLPYNETQIGAIANTRALNPITLARMSEIFSCLIEAKFQIENPFLFQTKGEMCLHHRVQSQAKSIPETFSCDHFPNRYHSEPQCGYCTSCLLRRLSLETAGLSIYDLSDKYQVNLFAGNQLEQRYLFNLLAMECQANRIKMALGNPLPWRELSIAFPGLPDIVSYLSQSIEEQQAFQNRIIQLYSRYIAEWELFSARRQLALTREAA